MGWWLCRIDISIRYGSGVLVNKLMNYMAFRHMTVNMGRSCKVGGCTSAML